ncbi:MAG TPA: hypothetical protein VHO03_16610 [Ignavibacteriales bacterium]|nr:hypothetical protein [Ignavibacteriales bacterium]
MKENKLFYIISLKWTHKDDGYLTLWRTSAHGYCWDRAHAGLFEEEYIQKNHSDPLNCDTKAVPKEIVDKLWARGFVDGKIENVLPSSNVCRKALGLDVKDFRRLYRSEGCPDRQYVESFTMPELKKNAYVVIKREDIEKYLFKEDQDNLEIILQEIADGREEANVKQNEYYVCNMDEPYADKVLKIILEGEAEKNKNSNN